MYRAFGLACGVLLLLCACESTAPHDESESGVRGNVLLRDAHNYESTSSLSIPTIETASGSDVEICWSEATADLQCHDLEPQAQLDTVALVRFLHLDEEQVEDRLTAGQLAQSETDGYLEYLTDHESTCAPLSSLTLFGTEVDIEEHYREGDEHTYLLLFAEGTTPGVGARTMLFIRPTSDSTNTRVNAPSGCGLLEFSARLSSAEPVRISRDGPWVIDWRDVTRDSQGNDIVFENIDGLMIGFFADMTVAELEAQILDLELIATSLWELELTGGRTADLADARGRDGSGRFPGFAEDEEGVWLLALMCRGCQNPSPVVLAVLEPSDEVE